jgi:DNA-binding NtrC family response regulator
MKNKDLERVLDEHVKPVVERTIQKYIGVSIKELNKDITEKLKKNPLIEFNIDTNLPLKIARKAFRKRYLERLLKSNFGDISAVAKICEVDRKTIHRMIIELDININECRKALLKPEYVKMEALSSAIEETLKHYDKLLHPEKLSEVYKNVDKMSENILKEFSFNWPSLKNAENNFEKDFIEKAVEENKGNVSATARILKIRYETLYRKIKELRIEINRP